MLELAFDGVVLGQTQNICFDAHTLSTQVTSQWKV